MGESENANQDYQGKEEVEERDSLLLSQPDPPSQGGEQLSISQNCVG